MARQRRRTSNVSALPILLLGVTTILLLALAGLFVFWAAGFFDSDEPVTQKRQPVDHTGQLAFPALARDVLAFEKVTRDDYINPQTGQLNVVWMPESVTDVASRNMSELVGRVLSRDKKSGMVLTEADLLEKGTRPGLTAGVPVGKFAVSIPASDVAGLNQLRHGDHFDLLIAVTKEKNDVEDVEQIATVEPAALFGGVKPPSIQASHLLRQHGIHYVVRDGMLIQLFSEKAKSTTGFTGLDLPDADAKKDDKKSGSLFAELAIDQAEIGPLTEAITKGTTLTCVVRSGKPIDEQQEAFSTEGMIPVITTATSVAAYAALSDENLIDETTGELHYYYFPADKVADSWIKDPTDLYGRVLARNLRRGAFITEDDLLPPGTRAGLSAGLPPGMVAMSIQKENVQGFENLTVGESFSILTRVPNEVRGASANTNWARLHGGRLSDEDSRIDQMLRTGIREVADQAIYLTNTDSDHVVIGVPEEQVSRLAQLLRDKVEVFAIAKSSQESKQYKNVDRRNDLDVQFKKSSMTRFVVNQIDPLDLQNEDSVAIPILIRDVSAFGELSIDDFVDPSTGRVKTLLFDRSAVEADWIPDLRQLIDRVPLKDLRAGRPVRIDELAPEGTPPSPAVGLQPNERAITVNSAQVAGLKGLPNGSVFDLATARGMDVSSFGGSVRQVISSPDAIHEAAKVPTGKLPVSRKVGKGVRLLADLGDVEVVFRKPAEEVERQTKTQSSLLADGSIATETVRYAPSERQSIKVRQYMLAVDESDVGNILGSLDLDDPLFVSLRPIAPKQNSLPSPAVSPTMIHRQSSPPVRAVIQEHIRGNKINKEVFLTDQPDSATSASNSGAFLGRHDGAF